MGTFRWEQQRYRDKMQHWALVHRESGRVVLQICLSNHSEQKQNYKIRRKIQRIYEVYFNMVYFQNFDF